MWQGKKLVQVDTIEALQVIQWAYLFASRIEPTDGERAHRMRQLADSALSALIVVIKKRVAPVPTTVHETLAMLGAMRDSKKERAA